MAYTVTGNVQISASPSANIPVSAQVLNAYSIALSAQPLLAFTLGSGTGQISISKALVYSGTIATNTSASAVTGANLSTGLGVDGAAVAFAHVRLFILFNDGNSAGLSVPDNNLLLWDTTVGTSWGPGAATAGPFSVATVVSIPAGTAQVCFRPWNTAGWTVSSNNVVALGTPSGNTNTIAYRLIVLGD